MAICVTASLLTFSAAAVTIAAPLPRNWPMPPSELEKRFREQDFEVLEAKPAGSGVTGAFKATVRFPDGKKLDVKWKFAPPEKADAWNNSPRKELAVYEIQRWLFDENDFVVPTVATVCLPMDKARTIDPAVQPTFPDISCALGTISAWMTDVHAPADAFDRKSFADNALYARYLADVNVLTYLIGHRDSHEGNLLVANDPADPRVYAVDNGIAFDLLPWNLRVFNWFRIRVPWLRRATIDRLRRVDKPRVRALAVVAELEAGADGVLHEVATGPNLDPSGREGVRHRGHRVQLGLNEDEIDDLRERIEKLIKKVDSGRQPVR
jgi:hypothetical protein